MRTSMQEYGLKSFNEDAPKFSKSMINLQNDIQITVDSKKSAHNESNIYNHSNSKSAKGKFKDEET